MVSSQRCGGTWSQFISSNFPNSLRYIGLDSKQLTNSICKIKSTQSIIYASEGTVQVPQFCRICSEQLGHAEDPNCFPLKGYAVFQSIDSAPLIGLCASRIDSFWKWNPKKLRIRRKLYSIEQTIFIQGSEAWIVYFNAIDVLLHFYSQSPRLTQQNIRHILYKKVHPTENYTF